MSRLFEPMTLRGRTFRNRIFLSPMCMYSVPALDGVPTDWHMVHLGARAQGGFGLVMAEATAVVPEGRISPLDAGLWNDVQRDAWAPIVAFVQSQGALAGIQLAHAGRKASTPNPFIGGVDRTLLPEEGGWQTVAPSAVPFDGMVAPLEMTVGEIKESVQAWADAARRADEAGFDVIELHAAHGYLIHEFLSPLSNVRRDEWGGDLEGRSRYLREIIAAIREVWPEDKPLFARLSATDWTEGGNTPEEVTELARIIGPLGVDLVDVSSGGSIGRPVIPVGPGYQVPLARVVRTSGMPVGAVGMISSPQQAESILVDGAADVVFIGRAGLREPGWPQRAAHELGLNWRDAHYPPQYSRGKW